MLARVEAAEIGAAEQPEQRERVDAAAVRHAVLAVGGEGHVVCPQRATGADLRRFLSAQRGPETELALPLQGDGLGVDAPDEHEIAIQIGDLVVGDGKGIIRMLDALTLGGEQLNEIRLRMYRRNMLAHRVPRCAREVASHALLLWFAR